MNCVQTNWWSWGDEHTAFQITIETFNRQIRFIKIRKIVHTRKINTILILLGPHGMGGRPMYNWPSRWPDFFCLVVFFALLFFFSFVFFCFVYIYTLRESERMNERNRGKRKFYSSCLLVFVRNCMRFPLEVLSIHTGWLATILLLLVLSWN